MVGWGKPQTAVGRLGRHLHACCLRHALSSAPFRSPRTSFSADAPSAGQDVIYTLLVVLLAVTAYNERKMRL